MEVIIDNHKVEEILGTGTPPSGGVNASGAVNNYGSGDSSWNPGQADAFMASVLQGAIEWVETLADTSMILSQLQEAQQTTLGNIAAMEAAANALINYLSQFNQGNYGNFQQEMKELASAEKVLSTASFIRYCQNMTNGQGVHFMSNWTTQQVNYFVNQAENIANKTPYYTGLGAQMQGITQQINSYQTLYTNVQAETTNATQTIISELSQNLAQVLAGLSQVEQIITYVVASQL